MKAYTIQLRDFLKHTDKDGFIIPQRLERDLSIFTDNPSALGALEWMKKQYVRRIQLPLDRDFIWLWQDVYHLNYARKDSFTDFNRYSFFTFEVPARAFKENILWSDFIDWHAPLNHIWGEDREEINEFERIFDLPKHPRQGTVQGVTTRLHKDWIKRITQK
ncbi:DUF3841 domain-containing protein [Enterococcus sp. AZ103]|uniref:DUF3841 domain-containing protein n=1 Tax=Enterococcus sp. AZ103 TaxID=2774628 RepID=UPI003F1F6C5D